jgi:hypothetical protein
LPSASNGRSISELPGQRWRETCGIYSRLLSTSRVRECHIPLKIRKYFLDLNEAENGIKATGEGFKNAKKWEVAAVTNFEFGIGSAKEIFDALQ